ncbi:hypothetical protein GCM10023116_05870 [Kistimonas scapharcae]|uniref:Uncharacterized protein n=1 Tax=Kistimonas scapharcae TaxID=1036133 RepID=A0ABP8UZN2_9GAMM
MKAFSNIRFRMLIVVVAGLTLLGFAANEARKLVQAGAYNNQTEAYLDFWREKQAKQPDEFSLRSKDYEVALNGARRAIELLPDAPEQWVLKARVLDWGQQYGLMDTTDGKTPLLGAWRDAIALRPAWPYAWSDYAMAMAQQSQINQDFEKALLEADRLGPWEERVLENSATLGLHYPNWLSENTQETLNHSLQRLAERYPHKALAISRRYGQEGRLCQWLAHPERVRECQ